MTSPTVEASIAVFDADLPLRDQAGRRLGYVLAIVVVCGALVAWAGAARVETIVRGEGRIVPSARAQ